MAPHRPKKIQNRDRRAKDIADGLNHEEAIISDYYLLYRKNAILSLGILA